MTMEFQIPERIEALNDSANLALAFGYLASRLAQEKRTRCEHPDGRRENVAEHALMLVKVAVALAETYYPELDAGKVAIYASLHDDVEAYVGDTPTDQVAAHDPVAKKKLEEAGVNQLVNEFTPIAPRYVAQVQAYERQEEPEARFVRVVDKIMVELIHFPNQGAVLQRHYTYSSAVQATENNTRRLKIEYPEFSALIDVKFQLAQWLQDQYLTDEYTT